MMVNIIIDNENERDRALLNVGLYLFELIRSALSGVKAEEKPEAYHWKMVYQLAKSNDVENICAYGIRTLENLPPEQLWSQWKKIPEYTTFRMLKVDLEREKLLKEMEENGISHLLFKGNRIAECYPEIGMRKMSDNDILYGVLEKTATGYHAKENLNRLAQKNIQEIMKKRGYTQIEKGIVHDIFLKDSFYVFEMHKKLVSRQTEVHKYYENPWKRAVRDLENPYKFHFLDEDEFIFMVVHAYKHFSSGGCGIRIFPDLHVFVQKKRTSMDWVYVRKELKNLGLETFAKNLYEISNKLLGEEKKELLPEEIRTILFMLAAGSYGTVENNVKKQTEKSGRIGYLFRRVFPPKLFWYETFPICEKYPWMIGVFWLYRLLTSPYKQRKRVGKELKALLRRKQ